MIQIKVYEYDSSATNYLGTELTQYVLQGAENNEKLNNELDVSNITLQGITRAESYPPSFKFIIDSYQDGNLINRLHRVVQNDTVTRPVMKYDNYFIHNITLTEPSVIAQQRLVDNISITYKLKDVNLETLTTYDTTRKMQIQNSSDGLATTLDGFSISKSGTTTTIEISYGKYIDWVKPVNNIDSLIVISDHDGTYTTNDYYNLMGTNFPNNKMKFLLPKPRIAWRNGYAFNYLGYASVCWTIRDYDGDTNAPTITSGEYISNSKLNTLKGSGEYSDGYNVAVYKRYLNASNEINEYWLPEHLSSPTFAPQFTFRKYSGGSSAVDFSNITLETDEITIQNGHRYEVEVYLKQYEDALPSVSTINVNYQGTYYGYISSATKYTSNNLAMLVSFRNVLYNQNVAPGVSPPQHLLTLIDNYSQYQYNDSASTSAFTYTVAGIEQLFVHSVPYSALTLIQKAILNSGTYYKKYGIPCNNINYNINDSVYANVNDSPFYIDDSFIQELESTRVIENFYNQKNLWEVLQEVGYYIHAIPEIKFGANEKFMITFNKLGETNESTDNGTKSTIMNFRGIDDYICATNSYITNMVQLGGQIVEYVSPKTSSEDYLVYNDTIEIHTSKPIIELLSIKAIPSVNYTFPSGQGNSLIANQEYDITKFIFEKNVYQILSIDYDEMPNKGASLYYELGTNKIVGCNYQLPRANTDAYSDYAIKKILWLSNNNYDATFGTNGPWVNICVNDFNFKVTYRTKDDVRQTHTRPDIRKYVLNTKWDRVPQHNQINNQTDTLVDSNSFGSKMYGTLIRTGNNEYTITEWVDDLQNLKHKGELYRINNELYYVYEVTNAFYVDHIVSTISYSKDYNQLSQVIGIPSEPRFYEISEQSSIRRDVALNEYVYFSTDHTQFDYGYEYDYNGNIIDYGEISNLIIPQPILVPSSEYPIGYETVEYPKYAITTFKGDVNIGYNDVNFGVSDHYKSVINPINVYRSGNTLTYEWDMEDNFSAGNNVVDTGWTGGGTQTADNTYRSLKATQYCDKYGKATLMDFYILKDLSSNPTANDIRNFPNSPYNTIGGLSGKNVIMSNIKTPYASGPNTQLWNEGIILLKDCRESISVNVNIQAISGSDQFVFSPFLFDANKTNISAVFLNKEVDKLGDGYIDTATIIRPYNDNSTPTLFESALFKVYSVASYDTTTNNYTGYSVPIVKWVTISNMKTSLNSPKSTSNINNGHFNGTSGFEQIKAIAFICETQDDDISNDYALINKTKFIMARNIPSGYSKANALADWYFGQPRYIVFTNKQ